MNPSNWLTSKGGFPNGGDPVWQDSSLAGQLLRDDFFGAEPSGVFAQITGAQSESQAGSLSASGAVDRTINGVQATANAGTLAAVTGLSQTITGVQASAIAGTLAPSGAVNLDITGAQATALAGVVVAGDIAPPVTPSWPAGGGRHIPRRALVPDVFISGEDYRPPVSIPANILLPSVQASSWAGWPYAQGGHSATATFYGAKAAASVHSMLTKAGVNVKMPSAAANRAPAIVCLGSAVAVSSQAEVKAYGVGISDEEILALLIAA